jgi:hypothetical protein
MTTKTTAKQAECTAAYKAEFAKAATLLKLLNHYVRTLGGADPTTVHWGDVGSVEGIVEWLRIPAAMVLNIDSIDPEFPQAVAKYLTDHGLAERDRR